jgi:succinyl-CoA synthetase alpha subunit
MTLQLDDKTTVIIQGITGRYGEHYTQKMIDYGTQVVGGVTPGKGGEWFDNRPIFDTVARAVDATDAHTSLIVVPPPYAADAMFEAINAGIKTIVCITEHIPVRDTMRVLHYAKLKGVTIIGPNSSGIMIPNQLLIGLIPPNVGLAGNIGVVSKSGTLLYDVATILTKVRLGQTMLISVGSDPLSGVTLRDMLEYFENDPNTERVVMLGSVGGRDEIDVAEYVRDEMTKPVIAMVTGHHAPKLKRLGHAGAILDGLQTSAEEKISALQAVGVRIATYPEQIPDLLLNLD